MALAAISEVEFPSVRFFMSLRMDSFVATSSCIFPVAVFITS